MSISNDNNTIEQNHSLMQNLKNDRQNYTISRKKGALSKIVPRHKNTDPYLSPVSSHKRAEEERTEKNEEVIRGSVC